jgi:hypothetical protein
MDYKEKYLEEKLRRLQLEAELLVLRHGDRIKEHEKTKKELDTYKIEKFQAEAASKAEKEEKPKKKRTYKRKKKSEGE